MRRALRTSLIGFALALVGASALVYGCGGGGGPPDQQSRSAPRTRVENRPAVPALFSKRPALQPPTAEASSGESGDLTYRFPDQVGGFTRGRFNGPIPQLLSDGATDSLQATYFDSSNDPITVNIATFADPGGAQRELIGNASLFRRDNCRVGAPGQITDQNGDQIGEWMTLSCSPDEDAEILATGNLYESLRGTSSCSCVDSFVGSFLQGGG